MLHFKSIVLERRGKIIINIVSLLECSWKWLYIEVLVYSSSVLHWYRSWSCNRWENAVMQLGKCLSNYHQSRLRFFTIANNFWTGKRLSYIHYALSKQHSFAFWTSSFDLHMKGSNKVICPVTYCNHALLSVCSLGFYWCKGAQLSLHFFRLIFILCAISFYIFSTPSYIYFHSQP